MTGGIHPWRRFRALAHIRLARHDAGPRAFTDFDAGVISIRGDQDQAGRRSAILHECLHVERGEVPDGMKAKEEVRVRRITAQLLLPDVRVIADALAWSEWDIRAAAEELWVAPAVLRDRLRHMTHPAERAYMQNRFEETHP